MPIRRGFAYLLFLPALFAQRPDFEVRVVEDTSGNPLPSAEAKLRKTGARELAADLDTGRDGVARASGLAPGDYTLTVVKPNFVSSQLRVRVPAGPLTVRLVHYGVISGQVSDANGRPVPGRISAPYGRTIGGARIIILTKSDAGALTNYREVTVEEEGRYRIYDLPPGQYAVGLWYDGLADGSGMTLYPDTVHPRWFTIGGGEEHNGVDFQIPSRPAVRVSGRVALPDPKARFALSLGLPEQPLLPVAQTLTDSDGSFNFEKIPAGAYELFAASTDGGYGARSSGLAKDPQYARVRVSVGATDVGAIEVATAPARSAVVKLAGEKPPEGCPQNVTVTTRFVDPWAVMQFGATTPVAYGKEAVIRDLPPGRVEFNVTGLTGNCYAASAPVVDLGGEPSGPVTLELATGGSLRGTLRGAPMGARYTVVLLESDAPSTADARVAVPGADGRFQFDSLKPGRYRIAASTSRWVSDPSKMIEIQIPGGSTTEIDLPAPKGERP